MARVADRRRQNVAGPFFVDETCIDCDTCRWMAPEVFERVQGKSAVTQQPRDDAAHQAAAKALVACPTASIGVAPAGSDRQAQAAKAAVKAAPRLFPDAITDGIYHCGYHAPDSFGATSYLIVREGGNVLVDSPRYNDGLAGRIRDHGEVRWLYLTHRDDVADHARWADVLGCERVLHKDDVTASTRAVEIQPEGEAPLRLADDLLVVPVPGHTKGHTVLHHDKALFTGDHLAYSAARGHLVAFRRACWYDWGALKASMQRLVALDLPTEWILPGHGRRYHAEAPRMREALAFLLEWLPEQD